MTDLLTHAEYSAIAEALDPPRSPFIDGKYQRGNGPVMATINPASGAEIAQISTARCNGCRPCRDQSARGV